MLLDDNDEQLRFTTSHIPYHEGTHLIGKYTDMGGVEHDIDVVFKTINDIVENIYQNCILILKECEVNDTLWVNWDIFTGAIYIMDDNRYYVRCEITSGILDEDLSLSTNNELSKNSTINELRKYGFGELQPSESVTLPFELSLVNGKGVKPPGVSPSLARVLVPCCVLEMK